MLVACSATGERAADAPVAAAPVAVAPARSADASAAELLVTAWRGQGLKAEAEYEQRSVREGERLEFRSLNVVLPSEAARMDGVMQAIGHFAARASRPVDIHLYARTRKQDTSLSQALKKGAVQSGGRNSVKLDHHIHPDFVPRVQVTVREGKP